MQKVRGTTLHKNTFAPSLLDDRDHTRRLPACRRSVVGLFDGFNSTNRAR